MFEKAWEFQKNIYFCFIDYSKAFDCVDHNKLWKILQEVGIPDHLTCLFRNLYAGQEATVRTAHGTTDWFQIGKGVHQGCILSPFTGVQPQLDPGIPSGGRCRRLRIASVERIRGLIVIGLHGKSIYPHAPITLAWRKSRDKRKEKEKRKNDTGRLSLVSRVCSFISSRGFYTLSCT